MCDKLISYGYDKSLCVYPTSKIDDEYPIQESQFEAFQSITARILTNEVDSPYMILLRKANLKLVNSFKKISTIPKSKRGIYVKRTQGGAFNHYIAIKENNERIDPYMLYQANKTEGFCQLFAYFIAVDDDSDFETFNKTKGEDCCNYSKFEIVDQTKKIDVKQFNILAKNTQKCACKLFYLLEHDIDFYNAFETKFNDLFKNNVDAKENRKYYGIHNKNTTFNKYIEHFKRITCNLNAVKDYIHDIKLNGWEEGCLRTELWNSYH